MNYPSGLTSDNNLSICVVTQQIGNIISGIGLHAYHLVNALVDDGHRVTVIAPNNQKPSGSLPYNFIEVSAPLAAGNQARWFSLSISFSKILTRLQRHKQFDLIHFTDAREALFTKVNTAMVGNVNDTYAASIEPVSYYRKYYDDWLLRWAYYHLVHISEGKVYPQLNALIANSQYTANVLTNQYRINRDRLFVCNKCIDLNQFTVSQKSSNSTLSIPRILFVGGNMQRKGLPTLIYAAPKIIDQFPTVEFWILGRDKSAPKMKQLCSRLGVLENFTFKDWIPQSALLEIYTQADVFVLPSMIEAFGVVFLEAMASGVPVIGSRVGGIPELISDGDNGILIEPGDEAGLATSIINLLKNHEVRERLRSAGIKTAKQFNIKSMMQCTYRVYQSILTSE